MAKMMLGGLLSGLGRGMVTSAEQKREDALRRAREMREDRHRTEDRDWRREDEAAQHGRIVEREEAGREFTRSENEANRTLTREEGAASREFTGRENEANRTLTREEGEADRSFRGGLLSTTVTGADAQLRGITAGGDVKDLGVEMPASALGGSGSGRSAIPDDIEIAEYLAAQDAAAQGREPTAEDKAAALREVRAAKTDPNQRTALVMRMYEAAAMNPADRRSDDEKMTTAERIVDGLLESDPGVRGRQPGQAAPASGSAQDGGGAAEPAPGAGTRADPYKATTQAHVDWFRQNAPAGAVIEIDGTLYTK